MRSQLEALEGRVVDLLELWKRTLPGQKRRDLNPWLNSQEAAAHVGLAVGTLSNAVQRRELTVNRESERSPFSVRLDELERWFVWKRPPVPALEWPGR